MAANIVVVSKNSAETLINTTNSKINLSEPSIVQLGVNRADVAKMDRLNNSLVITLNNGEVITIDNFFNAANSNANSLVLRDSDGSFWLADINAQNGAFVLNDYLPLQSIQPLLESNGINSGAFAWLLGAVGVGGLVALFSNSDSGSDSGSGVTPPPGGGTGTPDTTAPNAPSNLTINDRGNTLTGRAEAGSTVIVKTENGSELGRATADGSGNFSVSINPAQTNGQVVEVTATDAAGNTSVAVDIAAPDSTAPASPEGVSINATGTVVTGKAEAGSVVSIKIADGTEVGRATVGTDGQFSINLSPAQANGEQLTIVATDAANNASQPITAIAPDITAPAIPTDLTINPAGSVITGKAEAGSTVIARDENSTEIGRATADGSGNFSITLQNPEIDGEQIT
ncbi:MAG: BapA prefix-like domain-containing protein, partial [Moraxellaceae bacterium]